ncbi:MAG: PD-(D/E)XK nuclease family protein [Armatimonadetes bacterium]|nr:PD-(D/E)XK nuclease family protein [Armatimonadota bacterium]MDE2205191.1 PD-(D/E)XK nuclease family protein [Armatimonadota bacterium]
MPIELEFTGWEGLFLPLLVASLHRRFVAQDDWDMGAVVVVLRSARGRARLLQLLAERAAADHLLLTPPDIVTPGRLPEALMAHGTAEPPDIVDALAWLTAVHTHGGDVLADLLGPAAEAGSGGRMMRSLSDDIRALYLELSAAGLSMLEASRRLMAAGFADAGTRIAGLEAIVSEHNRLVEAAGFVDREAQRATTALHGDLRCDRTIVLAGVVELPVPARDMLLKSGAQAIALVHAPESAAEGFDALGCLDPEYWLNRENAAGDLRILTVKRPAEQAPAIALLLNEIGGDLEADAVTVGLCDERLAAQMQRELTGAGVPCRIAAGTELSKSTVFKLLRSIAAYVERPTPSNLAILAREPDLAAWMVNTGVVANENILIRELDRWITELTPCTITPPVTYGAIQRLLAALDGVLHPLLQLQPASETAAQLMLALGAIYQSVELAPHRERSRSASLTAAAEILRTCAGLRADCDLNAAVSASELLRLLTDCLAETTTPDELSGDVVELAGWLELHLDDAQVLLLASANDEFLPARTPANALITADETASLATVSAGERLARDSYLFAAMRVGRRAFAVVCSQSGTDEEPLMPSRLLAQCEPAVLVDRIKAFTELRQRYHFATPDVPSPATGAFLIPPPDGASPALAAMPVTGFRAYLRCPYRFYLKYVRRVREQRDDAVELDPAAFGNLLHATLAAFGRNDAVRDEQNPETIARFLRSELEEQLRKTVGSERSAFVEAQHIALESRLEVFARLQAQHAAAGWRIVAAETELAGVLPGTATPITGRIDRIDRRDGHLLILDYKSGRVRIPEKSHRGREGDPTAWIDLQLPAYLLLTDAAKYDAESARAGIICLPAARKDAAVHEAGWTAEDLAAAQKTAVDVIHKVEAGIFWPPSSEPDDDDELSPILLDRTRDWASVRQESVVSAASAARRPPAP